MYIPPFTSSTWPVIKLASSLNRNFTAWATSLAVPIRFNGVWLIILSFNSCDSPCVISVSM